MSKTNALLVILLILLLAMSLYGCDSDGDDDNPGDDGFKAFNVKPFSIFLIFSVFIGLYSYLTMKNKKKLAMIKANFSPKKDH